MPAERSMTVLAEKLPLHRSKYNLWREIGKAGEAARRRLLLSRHERILEAPGLICRKSRPGVDLCTIEVYLINDNRVRQFAKLLLFLSDRK